MGAKRPKEHFYLECYNPRGVIGGWGGFIRWVFGVNAPEWVAGTVLENSPSSAVGYLALCHPPPPPSGSANKFQSIHPSIKQRINIKFGSGHFWYTVSLRSPSPLHAVKRPGWWVAFFRMGGP